MGEWLCYIKINLRFVLEIYNVGDGAGQELDKELY